MNIKHTKGYALVMAIIFMIILSVSSIVLYNSVTHVGRELKIKEKQYVKGYYAAVAGLRYASIVLRDPPAPGDFINHVYTVTGNELVAVPEAGGAFFNDIDVVNGTAGALEIGEMSIQIEEYHAGVDWNEGEYKVTANYEY